MTNYLIRRVIQMVFVILLSAAATFVLFNIAPGGPLTGLQQQQQPLSLHVRLQQQSHHKSLQTSIFFV